MPLMYKSPALMQPFNQEAFEAYTTLLARPDPGDLPRRAHVLRWEGDPNRRATRLHPILMAWLQLRFLEADGEELPAPARATWRRRAAAVNPGLRLLQPTGTEG
jgi:hypothetical protein